MSRFLQELITFFEQHDISTEWIGFAIFCIIILFPLLTVIISFSKLQSEKKKLYIAETTLDKETRRYSIKEINKELTEFYLPLRYYLIQSKMLYDTFALEEKKRAERQGTRFNTLKYLCQGNAFIERDDLILREIINIGEKQNAIIEEKNWTADGDALSALLSKYSAHLKILKLAYSNKNLREDGVYDDYTFPIELPGAIESQILKLLENKAGLISPKTKNVHKAKQIERYTKNALSYYNSTISLPPSKDLVKFKSMIKKGGLVCDVGCGSGRDSKYLIQNGFRVFSIEPSHELASIARSYPFIFIKEESIIDMHYPSRFDAMWCSAVLQHIDKKNLEIAVKNLVLMATK